MVDVFEGRIHEAAVFPVNDIEPFTSMRMIERQLARFARKRALADGRELQLTGTEFRLLRYFMLNPGKLLSKTRLTEHVYDQDFDRDSNLIEVYVRRLRDKLGSGHILTRRGQGYLFPEHPA